MNPILIALAAPAGDEAAHYIGPVETIARGFLPEWFFHDLMLGVIPWEIIVLAIPFTVTLFVLNRMLFKPMTRVFEERERRTLGARDEAAELEAKFNTSLERYEEHMAAARVQANEARQEIRKDARVKQDEILNAAREDMAATLAEIRGQVAAECDSARGDLKQRAVELASELAAAVLGRPVRAA